MIEASIRLSDGSVVRASRGYPLGGGLDEITLEVEQSLGATSTRAKATFSTDEFRALTKAVCL